MNRIRFATTIGFAVGAVDCVLYLLGVFYNVLSVANAPSWKLYSLCFHNPPIGAPIVIILLPLAQWTLTGFLVGLVWKHFQKNVPITEHVRNEAFPANAGRKLAIPKRSLIAVLVVMGICTSIVAVKIRYPGLFTLDYIELNRQVRQSFRADGPFREYQGKIYLGGHTEFMSVGRGSLLSKKSSHIVLSLNENNTVKVSDVVPGTIPAEILEGQPDITKEHQTWASNMNTDLETSVQRWKVYNQGTFVVRDNLGNKTPEYRLEQTRTYNNTSARYRLTIIGTTFLDFLSSPLQVLFLIRKGY